MQTQSPKILVVDDEVSLVQLCQLILEGAGYEVRGALSGRQALNMITEEMPDLILLDVMMPGMNGLEVCRHIRQQYANGVPRILIYTADDCEETIQNSIRAGADACLTKDTAVFDLPTEISSYLPVC